MNSAGQLRWWCRRGALELDLLLEKYLDFCFEAAGFEEQSAFIELLKLEDAQLLSYLMGDMTPEAEDLAGIVRKIKMLKPVRSRYSSNTP